MADDNRVSSDDHARGVHAKLFAECREENAALRAENEQLRMHNALIAEMRRDVVEGSPLAAENARLRALVSWIDGRLLDEAPHQEIRAAIYRWQETQKP